MRPCVMLLDQTTTALTLFAPPRKAKGEVNKFQRKKQGTRNVLAFVTHLILVYRNIQQHLVFNPKSKSSHATIAEDGGRGKKL